MYRTTGSDDLIFWAEIGVNPKIHGSGLLHVKLIWSQKGARNPSCSQVLLDVKPLKLDGDRRGLRAGR